MTNDKNFSDEFKPRKSSSLPVKKSSNNEQKYLEELETEKANLLAQVANYEKEQKLAVMTFKHQEKLLDQKEQQLISKDDELSEKEEQLAKLKTRIHQLFKDKKEKNDQETSTEEASTQTEETNSPNFEEQLLEKRLESLKEFGSYREQLQEKETEINKLNNQITLYQQKIKKINYLPQDGKEKLILIAILLIILIACLLLK